MRFHLFLFCFLVQSAFSQKDTVFHPYYKGIQLIEMKTKEWYPPTKAFLQADVSLIYGSPPPIYLLRNAAGKIIYSYNVPDTLEIDGREISNEEKTVFHAIKTKNTSSHIGSNDEGYNQLYPVYNFKEVEKNSSAKLKVGLMDTLGNIVLPIQFDKIEFKDSVFFATNEAKIFLFDCQFHELNKDPFDEVRLDNTIQNLMTVKISNKLGIISTTGEWKLLTDHDVITPSKYMNGYYAVKKNNKWGFIKMNLSEALPIVFPVESVIRKDTCFSYQDPISTKFHLVDSMGRLIVATDYQVEQIVNPVRFILMRYQDGYHRYLCDRNGNILLDDAGQHLWKLNEERIIQGFDSYKQENGLYNSNRWHILDMDGNPINDKEFWTFEKLDGDFLKLWDMHKKQWICNYDGSPVLDFPVDQAYAYNAHFYMYKVGEKYYFTDFHLPEKKSNSYQSILCFKNGLMGVSNDKKWTFINSSFKEIAPMEAESIECFNEGIAKITIQFEGEKQIYLMDTLGRLQPQWYKAVQIIKGGYAWATLPNGKVGLWDRKGLWLIQPEYDAFSFVVEHNGALYVGAQKGKYWYLLDKNGKQLVDFAFDKLVEISVHASIPQRRSDGFFAMSWRNFRTKVEYVYYNFDPAKSQVTMSENGTMGFEVFESKCNADGPFKCYGVRNWDGKMVVPPIYTSIAKYKKGTFQATNTSGIGLIDTLGNVLIPLKYKYMYELSGNQGYYQVGRHYGGWGLYTIEGKQIADTLYGGFDQRIGNLIPFISHPNYHFVNGDYVHDEQKKGFMDTTGKIVLPAIYDRYLTKDPIKGIITVVIGNEYYDIDKNGNKIPETAKSISSTQTPVNSSKKKRKKSKRHKAKWL